jgi:hypothetical protein
VTEHGHPVTRMIADATSLSERLALLSRAGGIVWSGRRLKPTKPVARMRSRRKTVADLICENRE